ncbi:MAG: aspartate aminotransferase family protein [Clostridia bacterium]|nr:aspartate aminotransferase family protein [Clostridia bacterium]
MKSTEIIKNYDNCVMHTYGRVSLASEAGCNASCRDADGKEFIDFGSGIGTNSLGFADSAWADAVSAQAHCIQHISNYYYNEVSGNFARKLTSLTGMDKLFFGNSGAEANECAIKIARKYSHDRYGDGRNTIITLQNSFHGRTIATLSATGQDTFHQHFFPFVGGFKYCPANDITALHELVDDTVCAIMFEAVQGEGGVIALDKAFVEEIFKIAEQKDILTIADEVQCGCGRTGKFLAVEHFGVTPDIVTMAKGLGGGLPIGVCLAKGAAAEVLTPGTHGSTFGGNPVVCAGGTVVLDRVGEKDFLDEISAKGEYIRKALTDMPHVVSVSGLGLMLGITLDGVKAPDILKKALEKGLLVLTAKEKLRLLPPLTITYEEIDRGLEILRGILSGE